MADQAVKFTPRDLNQAWHELQRSGERATFDAVRARAQQIREQAIAAEQTGALFMQDGGVVPGRQIPRWAKALEEVIRPRRWAVEAPPAEWYDIPRPEGELRRVRGEGARASADALRREQLERRRMAAVGDAPPRASIQEREQQPAAQPLQPSQLDRIAREVESRVLMEQFRNEYGSSPATAPAQQPTTRAAVARPSTAEAAPQATPAATDLEPIPLSAIPPRRELPEPPEPSAAEPKRGGRRFKPWQRLKTAWRNYISSTEYGAAVLGQRLRNDYQALINQALEAQLIDQAEAKQREKILESVGEQLLNEPVQMRLALGEGGAVKKDWEAYRKSIRQAVKDRGGDAKAVLEADRMVTEYQMKKFEEYGTQAHAALAAGDAQTARRLMSQAFQYIPTGTQMRFETRTSPQGQQLVAIFTDEESGEPVDAKVMSPESLLGYIERLKNPAAWLSIVSDLTAKERGQVLSAMDTEIRAAQAAAQQLSAEASMLSAQTSAARAARESEEGRGIMTPKDFSEMIQEENKLRSESLDENALPPIPIEDALKMRGLVERIHAYQPALSVGDIGHLVVKGWGDPQLIEKLVAAGLLPPGSDSAFADGGYVSRLKERASQMVRSGRQAVEESQKQGTGLAHRAGRELHNRDRKIDEVVDQAVR